MTIRASLKHAFALALVLSATDAAAQRRPPVDPDEGSELPPPTRAAPGSQPVAKDWKSAARVLRVAGAGDSNKAEAIASAEIFPDAEKVFMQVIGTDPRPIEEVRRGARRWNCSGGEGVSGCVLTLPQEDGGSGGSEASPADEMLQSIKLQIPMSPLPLTIWTPVSNPQTPGVRGSLLFDPRLMGRRKHEDKCAYLPICPSGVTDAKGCTPRAKIGDRVDDCRVDRKLPTSDDGRGKASLANLPPADTADLTLGLRWPATSELAHFQYLAVTDTCGNAMVFPFQRMLTVPVFLVASGGCGNPDGRVLRVFPSGGWVRVTGFNLDAPAAGNVASVTFRVTVPPLEDLVSSQPPPLLFPDVRTDELFVDCGPQLLKATPLPGGIPPAPPGDEAPSPDREPAKPGKAPTTPPKALPASSRVVPSSTRQGQPLAHQSLVIAPEPIKGGNCRLEYRSQTARRLIAPLALKVRVTRTDKIQQKGEFLLDADWIITPTDTTFRIPKLATDGESRLLLEVYSNPESAAGNVVLFSDAGRYQRKGSRSQPPTEEQLMRLLGSATIHTAPLCGEQNFETAAEAGKCLRGYFTVPAMLATLQVTRAPWLERPLITRSVLSAVGVAFAFDSYDPVARKAFPIAGHVGGFIEDLGDNRLGFTTYLGIAPTVPILGSGGNTTNIGLLGGLGMSYVTRNNGPDEGFKPTAFLSVIVQVGQVNPKMAETEGNHFGSFDANKQATATGGTY
jgi:hypothetical protein